MRCGSMGKNGVTGIIVPVPSEITNRIFHHHEVYAMVAEHASTELSEGDRIFFYDAARRVLEGEAEVEKISFEPARDVRRYAHDLYLSGDELGSYLAAEGKSEDSTMLVIKVEDATKYSRPLKCSLNVGKQGAYVNKEVSAQIMRENQ
jgi:hypothetical protein